MKAEELTHYKDYIKSEYWQERKRQYFAVHEKKCAVCGHPDVDLHHIRYGNYGRERDMDLAPLCRVHHSELHELIGVRRDSKYQSRYFIEEAREQWEAQFSVSETITKVDANEEVSAWSVEEIVATIAAPIWKLLSIFGLRK